MTFPCSVAIWQWPGLDPNPLNTVVIQSLNTTPPLVRFFILCVYNEETLMSDRMSSDNVTMVTLVIETMLYRTFLNSYSANVCVIQI